MGTRQALGCLAVAICLCTNAVVAAGQGNPKISARDQLVITVFGVKQFSNKYPVAADGSLEFPELGRIPAAGLTARELGDVITRKLKDLDIVRSPQVTVELEQTPNKRITVNGSVRTPGLVAYAGELTLLDALVRSGGRLPEADDEVLIHRAVALQASAAQTEKSPIVVNARELENGALDRNVVLQDGDVVLVRKAMPVTITGFVKSVGSYTIESGMTVQQALALAGGIADRGSSKRIEITRRVDGKLVTLKQVKETDVVKPGDIIKVGPRIM